MNNNYVKTPATISFSSIIEKNFTLSSSQFKELVIPNQNVLYVKNFLNNPPKRKDLGNEVGSLNYIEKSPYYFLRTKALQPHLFLPEITNETALPIMPNSFVQMDLKKGDLIISKDSNIGEIVILDKDYPNYMLSGALCKLSVTAKKYYLLAFIKHNVFREQLYTLVPKGATIRHAKTKFLECKIPLPNKNVDNVIKFIESITQAIINKELLVKQKHQVISKTIKTELQKNQKADFLKFDYPTINEIEVSNRLDTGTYSLQFKEIDFLIKNYKYGYFFLNKNLKSGSTPDTRFIGDIDKMNYRWVTPTHCSDYGVIFMDEGINLRGNNNINEDCILFINRTSKGGKGEFVGIATYYNFNDFKFGHHNQGIYQFSDKDKTKMLFILCVMNCELMRKYCAALSVGSKMKEMKMEHFLMIPFPNFSEQKQKEIAMLYHNSEKDYHPDILTLDNFLEQDSIFNENAGIYELDKTAKYLKKILNQAIDDIINDREVRTSFSR